MSDVFYDDFDFDEDFVEEPDENSLEDSETYKYDPVKTTPAYHLKQAEKALLKLKFVVEESDWKKTQIKDGAAVYSKNGINDDKTPLYMGEHVIDGFTPQSIFAVIGMRKLWDPWYEEGSLVENLDETTSLTYIVMQAMAGTKTRDLSLVEKIECSPNGKIYFASTSVESLKIPRVVDRIRAQLILHGWILEPLTHNPPRTKLTYVFQTKVNGWIPSVVTKKYLLKRPLVVYTIDQYLQKNGHPPIVVSSSPVPNRPSRSASVASIHAPKSPRSPYHISFSDQQPSYKAINSLTNTQNNQYKLTKTISENSSDWTDEEDNETTRQLPSYLKQATSPRQGTTFNHQSSPNQNKLPNQRFSEIPNSSQSKVQQHTLRRQTTIQPPSPVQDRTPAQPSDVPKHRPSYINIPPPPLSTPPHQLIKKNKYTDAINKAIATFKDNAKTLDDWKFYVENKGVKIYMKDVEGRSTPIIRGDYTIFGGYTANDYLALIKNLTLRKLWDDRFEDGKDIEIFDNDEIMARFASKGTFPVSGRDLALYGKIERDSESGRIVYTTTSIVDPKIPEVKRFVRAHLNFTGWQIDPKFNVDGNIKALDIIYIVDIDIKLDSIPSSILKTISIGTPMVLQRIDGFLQKTGFPPYVLKSSSLILSENVDPKTFQYDLSLVAENNGVTEIRFSKTMYPNGFDIAVTPKNAKVELLANNSEIFRITLPSDVSTDTLQIKMKKYESGGFKTTYEYNDIPLAKDEISPKVGKKLEPEPKVEPVPVTPITSSEELPEETETIQQYPLPKETETIQQHSLPKKTEIIQQHSLPKETEIIQQHSLPKETETIQQHSTQLIDPILSEHPTHTADAADSTNTTLVANGTVDIDIDIDIDNTINMDKISRKRKTLSFANSPSIINPEIFSKFKEEINNPEPNEPEEVVKEDVKEVVKEDVKEVVKEDIEEDIEEDLEEYIEEDMEEDMEVVENNIFDISKDIIIITDKLRLNSHQAFLMFAAMMMSFYAGKIACYFSFYGNI